LPDVAASERYAFLAALLVVTFVEMVSGAERPWVAGGRD
jgi:hypothetical protein